MKLYNTFSNLPEKFRTLHKNKVTIYVCGITPYDTTHLGHAFTYISFDALVRFLRFKGYKVIYTQNVTDINDRDKDILQKAKEQKTSWEKLAEFWTKKFLADMKALNWEMPTNYLKASENIPSMVKLIQKLLNNGLAYQLNRSVYLDISKSKKYGALSKLTEPQMLKLAKEFEEDLENPDKRHKLDITLWKTSTPGQPKHIPSFDSSFGKGRPGWHIECSAMGISSLGTSLDIHGGGKDLIFPHHEAEIAQSEGATKKVPFVNYWLHTGVVSYKGTKMSKSKKNLVMVSGLLKKYSPNAIRYLLLSNHWSNDWEYFEKDLIQAQKKVNLIENSCLNPRGYSVKPEISGQFSKIMDNNLNTPKALEFISILIKKKSFNEGKLLYSILGFKVSY